MDVFRLGVVIRITKGFALIITQQQIAVFPAYRVFGKQRYFSAAAGSVDYISRHGIACCMAAQALDYFEALADRRPEMG
jgi:hypothetical protein